MEGNSSSIAIAGEKGKDGKHKQQQKKKQQQHSQSKKEISKQEKKQGQQAQSKTDPPPQQSNKPQLQIQSPKELSLEQTKSRQDPTLSNDPVRARPTEKKKNQELLGKNAANGTANVRNVSGGKSKTAKPKAPPREVNKKENIFQAVVLADNFSHSVFGSECPMTQEGLIPLANRKIIDYTLEALVNSGVQEIIIYCSAEVEGMREHIKILYSSVPNCSISIIVSEDSMSLGDALRDLDGKGVIKNDFILISAGVVTNLALKPLLNLHRETMKSDKGVVMTLIHRKLQPNHRSRSKHQSNVIVINSQTHKVISFEAKPSGKSLQIPLENITDEMDIYMDSVDSGIAICSVNVPPLFSDNFDFTCMNDFIRGIIINEEILGNSIYLHRLVTGYASRIVDFDTFRGITLDILQRWTYPLVPDMPFGFDANENIYSLHKNFVYKAKDVKAAGSAIGKSVIIGRNTTIEEGVQIRSCVVGDNCTIHRRVLLSESHLGNNVKISSECTLNRCILMDDTVWTDKGVIEDKLIWNGEIYSILLPTTELDESDEDDDSELEINKFGSQDDLDIGGHQDEDFKMFSTEVMESLLRAFRQNVATENLVLEINSSKFAYNMTFKEVTVAILKGILNIAPKVHPEFYEQFTPKVQWEKIREVILKLKGILVHYVTSEESQTNLIQAVEEYANDCLPFRLVLMKTLHLLYDELILPEDSILSWYQSPSLYEAGNELREMVKQFVNWLEEADSESD